MITTDVILLFLVCNDVIKILVNDFFAKKINTNPSLKSVSKFKADTSINARVILVQSLENFYTLILQQPRW